MLETYVTDDQPIEKYYRRDEQNQYAGHVPQRGLLKDILPTREEIAANYNIIGKNTKGIEIMSKVDEKRLDYQSDKDLKDDRLHSVCSV